MAILVYETGSLRDMILDVATMSSSLAFITTMELISARNVEERVGILTIRYDAGLAYHTAIFDAFDEFFHRMLLD